MSDVSIMELDLDTVRREVGAVMPSVDNIVSISRAVEIVDPAEDEEADESGDTDLPASDSGGHI